MTSNIRKKQLSWQARNGANPETRRAAVQELCRIGAHERRLRSGS